MDTDSIQAESKAGARMLNMLHPRVQVSTSLQAKSTLQVLNKTKAGICSNVKPASECSLAQMRCFVETVAVFSQQKSLDGLWSPLLLGYGKSYFP